MFVASETAATKIAQIQFESDVRAAGYRAIWSRDLAPSVPKHEDHQSLKGKAAGVAVISRLPMREARRKTPLLAEVASRMLETRVYFGNMQVRVFAIYGVVSTHTGAHRWTEDMLKVIVEQIKECDMPTMILGDYNAEIDSFAATQTLESIGYCTLNTLHRAMYQKELPFTCRQASTPDTGLVSHHLAARIKEIWTIPHVLDTHDVLAFGLEGNATPLLRPTIRLPKDWSSLIKDKCLLEEHYAADTSSPQTLEEWSKKVENAVDQTIRAQHLENPATHVLKSLPRDYRGRCQERKIVQMPYEIQCKKGRQNDYEPPLECSTMAASRLTRQVRRVQSLRRQCQAIVNRGWFKPQQWQSVWEEWQRILAGPPLETNFATWISRDLGIHCAKDHLPDIHTLSEIEEALIRLADAKVCEDLTIQARCRKYSKYLDRSSGAHVLAHKSIRPPGQPVIHQLWHTEEQQACLLSDGREFLAYVERGDHFQQGAQILLGDWEGVVLETASDHIRVKVTNLATDDIPEEAPLVQHQTTLDPQSAARQLQRYWDQFWSRDDPPECEADTTWDSIHALVENAPKYEPFQIPRQTPEDWHQAIQSTKLHCARGLDAWSVPELQCLPRKAFVQLVDILEDAKSFPPHLMEARVIPLAKTSTPEPSQSRPITIMPLLYRLWMKIKAKKILAELSRSMPAYLTGFLKGPLRGAKESSYATMAMLEDNRLMGKATSGFSLDLRKCFNLVPRTPLRALLRRLGLPLQVIDQWLNSLKDLKRRWSITGTISPAYACTTGMPEGDPMSVIGMLAVSELWCHLLAMQGLRPSAFADNWTWLSLDAALHSSGLQCTIAYVEALKLQIDWQKCYYWSTSSSAAEQWEEALQCHLPDGISVPRVKAIQELGCPWTFQGGTNGKSLAHRFAKAIDKLRRLRYSSHCVEVRRHLVCANILPTALFGSEMVLIAETHLTQLRSHIAKALLTDADGANPALLLATMGDSGVAIDPELSYINQAILTARRYLLTLEDDQRRPFFDTLRRHQRCQDRCKGPAEVLGRLVRRLGWQPLENGDLQIDGLTTLDLCTSSPQRILRATQRSWCQEVLPQLTLRREHQWTEPLDARSTREALHTFEGGDKVLLYRTIAHAFQTEQQKAHWTPDAQGQCPYCHEPDSHEHRLVTCPLAQSVLERHPDAKTLLQDRSGPFYARPVMVTTTAAESHRHLHARHKWPSPSDEIAELVVHRATQGYIQDFFTDGSCFFPRSQSTRYSAFSIILDLQLSDALRVATLSRTDFKPDDSFALCGLGRPQHEQDIYRAELTAVTIVASWNVPSRVWCDNHAVCQMCQTCMKAKHHTLLHRHEHYDLLIEIWKRYHEQPDIPLQVLKIKAHQELHKAPCSVETYRAYGNSLADEAAQAANRSLSGVFAHDLEREAKEHAVEVREMKQIYTYLIDLSRTKMATAILPSLVVPVKQQQEFHSLTQMQKAFAEWKVPRALRLKQPKCKETSFSHYAYGPGLGRSLKAWMEKCVWPSDLSCPTGKKAGISWLELAIGFMAATDIWLPVSRRMPDKSYWVHRPATHIDARATQATWAEMARTMRAMIMQLEQLSITPIWPEQQGCRVLSPFYLGGPSRCYGLPRRPEFPGQSQVSEVFASLHAQSAANFQHFPVWTAMPNARPPEWEDRDIGVTPEPWMTRYSRAKTAVKEMKRKRAELLARAGA